MGDSLVSAPDLYLVIGANVHTQLFPLHGIWRFKWAVSGPLALMVVPEAHLSTEQSPYPLGPFFQSSYCFYVLELLEFFVGIVKYTCGSLAQLLKPLEFPE